MKAKFNTLSDLHHILQAAAQKAVSDLQILAALSPQQQVHCFGYQPTSSQACSCVHGLRKPSSPKESLKACPLADADRPFKQWQWPVGSASCLLAHPSDGREQEEGQPRYQTSTFAQTLPLP